MRYYLIFIGVLLGFSGYCQEVLTGLQVNPVIKARWMEQKLMNRSFAQFDTMPVNLPFFDDFSAGNVFPSGERWIDRFGFENNDLPVFPVNMGAMTLDAINDSGNMYPHAVPGPMNFIADYLTSRYIRLDSVFTPVPRALTPSDSIYLSFYFQPQGRARAPQKNDTLILEFLVKPAFDSIIQNDTIRIPDQWQQMWYSNGMPLDTFYQKNNKWFVQVLVPVTDTIFLRKDFMFRFYNYVSLASMSEPAWQSNTSQWNLDNVYLNHGRSKYDTIYPELRFIYPPPSMLKRYESMPYPQYSNDPTNELRDTLDILMSNRDVVPHMSTYNYFVTSTTGSFAKSYSGGSYIIQPYHVSPYVTYQKFAHPAVPFLIPIGSEDSATFRVQHIVHATNAGIGDTMEYFQKFYNYFAYDNGTPEASYGLSLPGGKLACRFKLNKSPDTLRAVNMYFNRTLSNSSIQLFNLCVWNDNAGVPGDTIYSDLVLPRYSDSLNHFVTYHLNPPLAITGTFYIGWIQTTGDNLSIGFDRYNNNQDQIFYNATGVWNNSAYAGSPMIRPVVGKPIPLGVHYRSARAPRFSVYPNPCPTGKLTIQLPDSPANTFYREKTSIRISDLMGRLRYNAGFQQVIDVSGLENGIYFMELRDADGIRSGISKFIISR